MSMNYCEINFSSLLVRYQPTQSVVGRAWLPSSWRREPLPLFAKSALNRVSSCESPTPWCSGEGAYTLLACRSLSTSQIVAFVMMDRFSTGWVGFGMCGLTTHDPQRAVQAIIRRLPCFAVSDAWDNTLLMPVWKDWHLLWEGWCHQWCSWQFTHWHMFVDPLQQCHCLHQCVVDGTAQNYHQFN